MKKPLKTSSKTAAKKISSTSNSKAKVAAPAKKASKPSPAKASPAKAVAKGKAVVTKSAKPVAKPVAKPAAKPVAKVAPKGPSKPVAKSSSKVVAKPAPKTASKLASKPVTKSAAKPAAKPAIKGAENDVPFKLEIFPFDRLATVPRPIAETSGLILLSKLGPVELNEALNPVRSTAPTLNMESASAGDEMYFQLADPSFPAEMVQIIPRLLAQTAANVLRAVLPFISW